MAQQCSGKEQLEQNSQSMGNTCQDFQRNIARGVKSIQISKAHPSFEWTHLDLVGSNCGRNCQSMSNS